MEGIDPTAARLDSSVQRVEQAVSATLTGNYEGAQAALGMILHDKVPRESRSNVPHREQVAAFRRDAFICRYCGKRTIFIPVLRLLSSRFPTVFPYQASWKRGECHPIYWTHSASCDHIVPLARGGNSSRSNLATACYQCNDMKSQWLLAELRWEMRPSPSEDWDGLSGVYVSLCRMMNTVDDPYHHTWLRALGE